MHPVRKEHIIRDRGQMEISSKSRGSRFVLCLYTANNIKTFFHSNIPKIQDLHPQKPNDTQKTLLVLHKMP